jgi:hypothetical protein
MSDEGNGDDLARLVASMVPEYGLEQIVFALSQYFQMKASTQVSKSDEDYYMSQANLCERWLIEIFGKGRGH